ncbi:MAG: RNA polymerase factor sigma-54 [Betaproteobacteria bacterium]|nr:RNA polymerase factor sigma-54 [Betaproteobacteria bacterium]
MKQSLQLRLSQHLTLTPQLQQSIRLLQLSTLELDQEIERYLRDNPLLERGDSGLDGAAGTMPMSSDLPRQEAGATASPDELPDGADSTSESASISESDLFADMSYGAAGERSDDEEGDYPQLASDTPTLREHLLAQLALLKLSERDRTLTGLLIDSLDDDGYLTQSLEDMLDMLPLELEIDIDELATALRYVQHLEPAGVGARSLSECLALQLQALPPSTPYCDKAIEIVLQHLEVLAAKDYAKLKRTLRCDDGGLRAAQKLITSLDPKPGRGFAQGDTRYVIPDVIVSKDKGLWSAALNSEAMPKLRVNQFYADILTRSRTASQSMAGQLQEARWLIKNVQQRFETILRVSQAIIERQRNFLEHGTIAMRPLVLREIAEVLELHESTVSRVTTNKFMRTPRGIFELKFFFGSHVGTDAGGAASSTAIRELIRQMIANENSRKPLSDSQLSSLLAEQGVIVARRTVAKYREALQILPGNLRKSL